MKSGGVSVDGVANYNHMKKNYTNLCWGLDMEVPAATRILLVVLLSFIFTPIFAAELTSISDTWKANRSAPEGTWVKSAASAHYLPSYDSRFWEGSPAYWKAPSASMMATYDLNAANDGMTFNVTCGTTHQVYDPGGVGGNYPNNQDNAVTFCNTDGGAMAFSMDSPYNIQPNDFLYVYDGSSTAAPQFSNSPIGSGTANAFDPLLSSGNCITLRFTSDPFGSNFGFTANIRCAEMTTLNTCTGNFYDSGGAGGDYSIAENSTTTICSDNGGQPVVNFTSFDIELDYEYFYVYDGPSTGSPLVGTYTGTTGPGMLTATGTCLTFNFVSDGSVTAPGWEASISCLGGGPSTNFPDADYTIDEGGTENTCEGVFADSGDTNGDYGDGETHTMTFCSDENNHISFTFEHFNTEASNDVLTIYDGSTTGSPSLGSYSGTNSPGVVTSSGTCLTFEFTSDGSTTAPGWLASISCTGLPDPGAASASWTGYPTASACSGSEQIGGTVYEDIDNDGTQDTREPGIFGATVTLFDDSGQVGSPVTTNANGEYEFTGLVAATVYRVEFTIPNGFTEGPYGSNSGTAVQFIESGRCDANLGLADAAHYCDDTDPYFVIPCYVNGDPQHSSNTGSTGIAQFRYSDSGDSPASTYQNYVTIDAIGTTWGVAFDGLADRLFMSSVLKRHAGLGPSGIGAIYMHDDGDPNTSAPVFYDFGAAAGTVASNATRFPGTGTSFGQEGPCGTCDNIDPTTFAQVGKAGFGDIDINPDNDQLYVTNLFDRKVYTVDLNSPAPGSATPLPSIPWLDNSPCNNGVARPWGLDFRRGKLYVGVVCDASLSSCTPGTACSDLTGIIYSFDGATWTTEITFPLDYYRDAYSSGSDYFVKWIDDWNAMSPWVENVTDANFAQPVIMDIEFDDDNSIIIGIGDRTGFQLGYRAPSPLSGAGGTEERNMAFGDILRASYNSTTDTYTLENNGMVGSLTTTNPTNNSGPGGKSFYWGDFWTGIGANKYQGGIGSLMLLPNSGEVATPLADAIDYYSNGISWMRNTNGSGVKRLEVYQGDPSGNSPLFAKGSGVGDMVLFCEARPIEIGNVVWWDDDLDGLQDPSEPGIDGVTVELYRWDGSSYVKVAETTTDSYGRYVFSQASNSNGLSAENWSFASDDAVLPNTQYQVRIIDWMNDTDLSTFATNLGYVGTLMSPANNQGAGGDERDNDAVDSAGDAVITLNTGDFGDNDHSHDFGFGGIGGCEAPEVIPTANTPCEGDNLNLMAAVSGGVAPYTYQWSGPNSFSSTMQNPTIAGVDSMLNVGMYSLTVTDNLGCVDTTHIHIAINKVTLTSATTDATCGSPDGEIDLTITGFPPYIIDWDNDGTGDNDDNEDLSGLSSGTYNVTVTDADGCVESTSASVGSSGSVTLSATHVDETCTLGNGSINLTITGAHTTIDWDNDGTGDNDDPEDLSGLSAGTYTVTVNNAFNCPAVLTVVITDTPGPSASATQVNTTCGASNGSIDLTVNGGTAPYQFDWDNDGTGDNDDPEDLTGLAAGSYTVVITDATGCTVTVPVTLTDTPGPSLATSPTDETCGNANGSIDLTVSGGTGPFMYAWSNGLMTEDISGLGAGTFSVTVTDANGCTATATETVGNIAGPTLAVVPVDATDCNSNDGSINLTVSGGTMPYSYDWDIDGFGDNDDVEDPGSLPSGTYMVIVTDNNGCQATISTTINNAADPVLSAVVTDPTTCGGTGSVDLTITGGNGPFTIDWSNDGLGDNDDMEDLSGLAPGNYTVIVTGADGCSAQLNASIQLVRDPVLTPTIVDPSCGASDGQITLSISDPDGMGPYTFDWDIDGIGDNDDAQNQSGLAPGNYSVTVTNGIGCTATATYSLSPSAAPSLTIIQNNPTCGLANGSIDLSVTGGTMPYQYDWDNDGTGDNDDMEDLSGLSAGTYSVTVTDNGGCQAVGSAQLVSTNPPVLTAGISPENCGGMDGAINLTITGVSPLTIDWDTDGTGDNDDPEDLSGLSAGSYSVTVTDANGCTTSDTYMVSEVPNPTISASPACDPGNTTYTITVTTTGADQLTSDVGSVSGTAPNFTVSGIPVGTDANLSATNTSNGCNAPELVTSPMCACPAGEPTVMGDTRCGPGTVNLSATSGANCDEIRWYDMATGGSYGQHWHQLQSNGK